MQHDVRRYVTKTGVWWLPTAPEIDLVMSAMKSDQIFEPDIVAEAERHIKHGSIVLDVGSSFGQMAVLFSRMVGPRGTVHAFEADPFVCELLRRNVAENGSQNIVVHDAAVWHTTGLKLRYPEPDFVRFGSFGSYGIDTQASAGREVTSLAIDSLALMRNVSFMKVDVQGSDLYAMMGARSTIKANRMPILFEYEEQMQGDFGTTLEDYQRFVSEIGYEVTFELGTYVQNFLIQPKRPFWWPFRKTVHRT